MIAADLTVTSARLTLLDFSRPFMRSPLTVLTGDNNATDGANVSENYMHHLSRRRHISNCCFAAVGGRTL